MNDYILVSELYHHGIKGMKWGVRKEYDKKDDDNKKRSVISGVIGASIGISAVLVGKKMVDSIANSRTYKSIVSELDTEISKMVLKIMISNASRKVG